MGEQANQAMSTVARVSFKAARRSAGAHQAQQVRWSGAMQQVKLRMKSVSNIAKITKAMQMVAASKLRGADARLQAGRPFTGALKDLLGPLRSRRRTPTA